MRKATVREVQHNLARVLKWVEDGEEVEVIRRNRAVARVVPAYRPLQKIEVPDFAARARSIWGERPKGKRASRIVIESREERL